MKNGESILVTRGGFLTDTYDKTGLWGCARKIFAAIKMQVPLWILGRRTNSSVGAYFDLITDDGRLFYGDNFHLGYFLHGGETLEEAMGNHTDAVAKMARLDDNKSVLDVGCGICAPAIHVAKQFDCKIVGVNISSEQVHQGRCLVNESGLSNRIRVHKGNALDLDFEDSSFDAILCIEVAGDICVKQGQKTKLIKEMHRVLKPGGHVGFSDLIFTAKPTKEEEHAMQAILYHKGSELMTDWPSLFEEAGFEIREQKDIIKETMKTWDHSLAVYETRHAEVEQRFGARIAKNTVNHLRSIPVILQKYGSFVVMSARKPDHTLK